MPPVFAPDHKRVIEHAAVHAYRPVYLVLCKCRSAYHHAFRQVMIPAAFGNLPGQPQIVLSESFQIIGKRYVAGTYLTAAVGYNGIYGYAVILHQPATHRQHVELLDAAGSLAYTPAHQHVELHAAASAQPGEPGDVECLEERDHGHRRIHPHFKRICPGRLFRVYFSHV